MVFFLLRIWLTGQWGGGHSLIELLELAETLYRLFCDAAKYLVAAGVTLNRCILAVSRDMRSAYCTILIVL